MPPPSPLQGNQGARSAGVERLRDDADQSRPGGAARDGEGCAAPAGGVRALRGPGDWRSSRFTRYPRSYRQNPPKGSRVPVEAREPQGPQEPIPSHPLPVQVAPADAAPVPSPMQVAPAPADAAPVPSAAGLERSTARTVRGCARCSSGRWRSLSSRQSWPPPCCTGQRNPSRPPWPGAHQRSSPQAQALWPKSRQAAPLG